MQRPPPPVDKDKDKDKQRYFVERRARKKDVHYHKTHPEYLGRGLPQEFVPLINRKRREHRELLVKGKVPTEAFEKYAKELELSEFKFQTDQVDPLNPNFKEQMENVDFDVFATDRYVDEIHRYRTILIEECRTLPSTIEIQTEPRLLMKLGEAIHKLGRNAYFGTVKAQKLAEGALPVIVWLLNRRIWTEDFHIDIHRAVVEMCWLSLTLKKKFFNSRGPEVCYQNMKFSNGGTRRLTCWACYTLAMALTGCPESIIEARTFEGIEDVLTELSFEYYWFDWPANFGMVLQGMIFGPNAFCPNEDFFQFR